MPSKIRDIAEILGVTETANTTNAVLTSVADGSGLLVYATLDDLPTSDLTAGDQAYITATNRLYVSNGSGWYNVALFNATPSLSISPSGAVTLAVDGSTPTVITLTGTDSDNADANLVYSVESDGSFANIATLSQDSSVFTITPLSEDSATPGSSTLTFKVSDGISFGSGTTTFSLTFGPDWSVSPTETIIRASDTQAVDIFGSGVGINDDGDWITVSARYEDGGVGDPLSNSGAVYVFNKSGGSWSETQKLTASDAAANDQLGGSSSDQGSSLMMSGDGQYIIAGAFGKNTQSGAAYIFNRSGSTWSQQQKISPPTGFGQYDEFGTDVALNYDGTYAAISAPRFDNDVTAYQGTVCVYTRSGSTWTQQGSNIQASDKATSGQAYFGQPLSFNGDATYLAVGSWGRTVNSQTTTGSVYMFTRSGSTWTEQSIIVSDDLQSGDRFGSSLKISSDANYLIVGSPFEDGGAGDPLTSSGAAYIFTRSGSTWTQQAKLTASDAQVSDQFGQRVSISADGNFAVVKARYEDGGAGDPISNAGALYVFERSGSTWTEIRKLTASDAQANDQLGYSIDINSDGSVIVAGTQNEDGGAGDPTSNAGAAYIYEAG